MMNVETVLAYVPRPFKFKKSYIHVVCMRMPSRYIAHDNPNRDEHNKRRMKKETEE